MNYNTAIAIVDFLSLNPFLFINNYKMIQAPRDSKNKRFEKLINMGYDYIDL